MGYNSKQVESFSNVTIKAGTSHVFRIGDQYCPENGWLIVWACDQPRQLTATIKGAVATAGTLRTDIVQKADMSKHGQIAIGWPTVDLLVECDSTDTEITISAYGIGGGSSGVGGWPNKLYRSDLKTIASGATGTFNIPVGATRWYATGSSAATIKLKNAAGDLLLEYANATGNVTIGSTAGASWYTTIEGGSIDISQATGSDQDWQIVFEYDLTVGSGLA